MTNLATYELNAATVTARNAQIADTPFTDIPGGGTFADPTLGCNKAGSCAPGIGIATDNIDPKLEDWSVLDQGQADAGATPLARTPQDSQHIGGEGLGDGTEGLTDVEPVRAIQGQGADINDTLSYIAAVVQAAPGAGYNTADADPVNRSSRTIEIGERLWGTNTVA